MSSDSFVTMPKLRAAIEASWKRDTATLRAYKKDNPSLGNCYPTARVVQYYFPKMEIVEGNVWTGKTTEKHFWNVLFVNGVEYHIDFTWQQFPVGSVVTRYKVWNREKYGDSVATIKRVELLLNRVRQKLESKEP